MSLSKRVAETLLDLVEIKLSCIEVHDREDKRELAGLERAREELRSLLHGGGRGSRSAGEDQAVVAFPGELEGSSQAAV